MPIAPPPDPRRAPPTVADRPGGRLAPRPPLRTCAVAALAAAAAFAVVAAMPSTAVDSAVERSAAQTRALPLHVDGVTVRAVEGGPVGRGPSVTVDPGDHTAEEALTIIERELAGSAASRIEIVQGP